jgi:hypothetical protein
MVLRLLLKAGLIPLEQAFHAILYFHFVGPSQGVKFAHIY